MAPLSLHRTMERTLAYLHKTPCGSSHPGAQKQLPRVLSQQVVWSATTCVPRPVQTAHTSVWELLAATGKPHSPSLGGTEEMGGGYLRGSKAMQAVGIGGGDREDNCRTVLGLRGGARLHKDVVL